MSRKIKSAQGALVPSSHVQLSFINRGCSWATLFCELTDNSFDPDAGGASEICFVIRKDSVESKDNGRGIDDPNRLGRLGDSKSYFFEGNIGQFGIGAKAWMCKARKLRVRSVHDGTLRLHTFDLTPVLQALAAKKGAVPWLQGYEDVGTRAKPGTASYSSLLIHDFRAEAGPIIVPPLISELQKTHWPALKAGRRIVFEDKRRKALPINVEPLAPPSWKDKIEFESQVNGRRYKATVGILGDHVGAYSGLFIGYLHRNIVVAKSTPTRSMPPRIHGQIELSEDWRHTLSNYKDDITVDKDALLSDIESNAKQIFDLADNLAEDIRLEKVAFEIENVASAAIRNVLGEESVKKPPSGEHSTDPSPRPITDGVPAKPASPPKPEESRTKKRDDPQESRVSGLQLRWDRLGTDLTADVRRYGRILSVTLNRDCPKLEALSRQPKYPGLYLMIGYALAFHCMDLSIDEIDNYFGGMLGSAAGSESKTNMMRAICVWWGFVAEEQPRETIAA